MRLLKLATIFNDFQRVSATYSEVLRFSTIFNEFHLIFNDYQLGEPFELGADCEFEAPSSGRLYLRVFDDYTSLADNGGKLEVTVGQPR